MRYRLALLCLFAGATLTTRAQNVQPLVDTQDYVFMAQSCQPIGNASRLLTVNSYYIKVTKGKIVSNLPYYGHIDVASTEAITSALDFTSGKFSYTVKPKKGGGWTVLIRPKDGTYIEELKLKINPDGYTVAEASFNGLDDISFIGVITSASALASR